MKYTVESKKSVAQAVSALEESVRTHGFGVLHIHDLQQTLKNKGVDLSDECQILEICNPYRAKEVLKDDMSMNMVLPCRISVYADLGKTMIGMIIPTALVSFLSDSEELMKVAEEVESEIKNMIEEAR